jgi:hypothetical protein
VLRKELAEQPYQFALAFATLPQEVGELDLIGIGAVTRTAHIAADLFMLDKQASGVEVER